MSCEIVRVKCLAGLMGLTGRPVSIGEEVRVADIVL